MQLSSRVLYLKQPASIELSSVGIVLSFLFFPARRERGKLLACEQQVSIKQGLFIQWRLLGELLSTFQLAGHVSPFLGFLPINLGRTFGSRLFGTRVRSRSFMGPGGQVKRTGEQS